MVARITTPHRISDALNYNEQKVQKGNAACIYAGNYLGDAAQLNFYQKLTGFEMRNSLNERATTKTMHISLNFDPSEKLEKDKLINIASLYVEKIGFGNQPYLVYQHKDAGHPHIHILTTTIQKDGSRINTHNIGRNQSETARKEIEVSFSLVKAERQRAQRHEVRPIEPVAIIYGKVETKRSINNVVNFVFRKYNFTTLTEFNAGLFQFNVVADPGKEEGRIFKNNGLLYRILDEKGNKVGVPIKASSLTGKPTLAALQEKFELNKRIREDFKTPLKQAIDRQIENASSLREFKNNLQKENVYVRLRVNDQGIVYGITYVDNVKKAVFNGSELGKQYSVQGIMKQMSSRNEFPSSKNENREKCLDLEKQYTPTQDSSQQHQINIQDKLMSAGNGRSDNIPFHWKRKKKRKRKNL